MTPWTHLFTSYLALAGVLCLSANARGQSPADPEPAPATTPASEDEWSRASSPSDAQPETPPASPDSQGDSAAPPIPATGRGQPGRRQPRSDSPARAGQVNLGAGVQSAATGVDSAAVPMGRGSRTHDGFYLRMSLGLGSAKVKSRDGPPGVKDAHDRAPLLDLMLGGTPSPGLVIGGGLWFNGLETNKWKRQNDDPSVGMVALGPFIDYFPDPHQGFHFGGTLGLAAWRVNAVDLSEPKSTAGGGAVGAWVGYDFWVSRQWSLGVQARYLGMVVENDDHDWRGAADTLGLSFTALCH